MRELRAQNRVCDRAREYSSRSLDGELSDFERALLETHLERCDACRAYAVELAEIVTRLRLEPLEALPHPVSLPSGAGSARGLPGPAALPPLPSSATAVLAVVSRTGPPSRTFLEARSARRRHSGVPADSSYPLPQKRRRRLSSWRQRKKRLTADTPSDYRSSSMIPSLVSSYV